MGVRHNGFKQKNYNTPVPSGGFLGSELFTPETVLPAQFYNSSAKESGEKRLLLAILEDAILCLQKYCHSASISQRRLYQEAKEWFLSGEEKSAGVYYPFHFVCAALNLDPEKLRANLKKWLYPQLPESRGFLPLFKGLPLKAVVRHLYEENHGQTLVLEEREIIFILRYMASPVYDWQDIAELTQCTPQNACSKYYAFRRSLDRGESNDSTRRILEFQRRVEEEQEKQFASYR